MSQQEVAVRLWAVLLPAKVRLHVTVASSENHFRISTDVGKACLPEIQSFEAKCGSLLMDQGEHYMSVHWRNDIVLEHEMMLLTN